MNAKHDTLKADPLAQTHEVFNQARALEDYNAYDNDTALREAVARGGPQGAADPARVTRAALRAWALVHGLGQLLLDGQLDWLEEDPLGLAEAVLADAV